MRNASRRASAIALITIALGLIQAPHAQADKSLPPAWTTLPPKGVRELYAGTPKLKPDTRLQGAMLEAHLFFSGPNINPKWNDEDTQWLLKFRASDGNALPDFPDFPDLTATLDQWLARFDFDSPGSTKGGPSDFVSDDLLARKLALFTPLSTTTALREIDRQWHAKPRASLVLLALRGYLFLLLDSPGRFHSTDPLAAKALALLAIYARLTPVRATREECLLAYLMDYSTYALKLSESLAADDSIRLFVKRDFRKLLNRAGDTEQPLNGEARYFSLLLAAYNTTSRGEFKNWSQPLLSRSDGQFLVPAFNAARRVHSIEGLRRISGELSRSAIKLTAAETGQSSFTLEARQFLLRAARRGAALLYRDSASKLEEMDHAIIDLLGLRPSLLIERFEELAKALPATASGPFLTARDLTLYYRDRFYSGLYEQALLFLDTDRSIIDARRYLVDLGAQSSTDGREFTQWYAELLATWEGSREAETLLAHFSSFDFFGFAPRLRSYQQLKNQARGQDQLLEQAAQKFASTLDSRPAHLNALRLIYNDDLLDFNHAEQIGSQLVRLAGARFPLASAWYAKLTGDRVFFEKILASHVYLPEFCGGLVDYMSDAAVLNTGEVTRVEREMLSSVPDGTQCMVRALQTLRAAGEFELAHSLASEWLNRRGPDFNDDDSEVAAALAQAYLDQGKAADAWHILKAALPSRRGNVLVAAVRALDLLKKDADAERVARTALERYPFELSVRAAVAAFYWRHGRLKDATALFKKEKVPTSPADWGAKIGVAFAQALVDHPVGDALAAYQELKAAGIDIERLSQLADAFSTAGQSDRSLAIAQDLVQVDQNRLSSYINIYRYMRRLQNDAEAIAWLEKTIPDKFKNDASFALYDIGDLDGIETFNRTPAENSEHGMQLYIDLLRIAAWMLKNQRGDHLPANLVQSFGVARPGLIFRLGKFMLKFDTLDRVLPAIGKETELCMASYYFGLLAATEKDFVEAADWWHIGHRPSCTGVTEFNWSGRMLKRIQARGISTRLLSKVGLALTSDFKPAADQPY